MAMPSKSAPSKMTVRKKNTLPEEFREPPEWFVENVGTRKIGDKPVFLYQSLIPQHTNKLVESLTDDRYDLVDLGMLDMPQDKERRVRMLRFAERHPVRFRRMAMHKLAPFAGVASGLIVTLDWIPLMRHIVYAASQLGIPTILVPHESVFAKADMYYVHAKLGIRVPACDLMLAWGNLQADIFTERGYPSERVIKVGAPKFDYLEQAKSRGNREPARLLGLDPQKPVVTFAAQPLDSQYDTAAARVAQLSAVNDLMDAVVELDAQLIIRTPPSKDNIFNKALYDRVSSLPNVAIDDANLYLLTPEQTIELSDVLVSINSTMLLEAALAGKVAITSKYVEFDQIWDGLKIPVARNGEEIRAAVAEGLRDPARFTAGYDTRWAGEAFSVGVFDGKAATRIRDVLAGIVSGSAVVARGYASTVPFATLELPARPEPKQAKAVSRSSSSHVYRDAYGVFGWRHLFTWPVSLVVSLVGDSDDARRYRQNPAGYFHSLSNPTYRKIGRLLYPKA